MTVYLKKTPVGVGRIIEKKVAKEKFGTTIDSFLGDVDADGNYIMPNKPVEVNLAGIKNVPENGFSFKFSKAGNIVGLYANDVVYVGQTAFSSCLAYPLAKSPTVTVEFNSLEEISSTSAFEYFANSRFDTNGKPIFSFAKLKRISGNSAFSNCASNCSIDFAYSFPALEEISGNTVFYNCCSVKTSNLYFPSIKKITGNATSQYSSTFGTYYVKDTVWSFPNATEFTGYIWNISTSYTGEIHFAAKNQAAIEACDGYANKWGFAGATIYFDL